MKYYIPLSIDRNMEPDGLYALFTTQGPVVVIFSNPLKLEKFLSAAAHLSAEKGKKVGDFGMDATSMSEVVSKLLEMDPSLAGTVTFLPDSDPMIDDFILQMNEALGSTELLHA